jgi:hypothetical protein
VDKSDFGSLDSEIKKLIKEYLSKILGKYKHYSSLLNNMNVLGIKQTLDILRDEEKEINEKTNQSNQPSTNI